MQGFKFAGNRMELKSTFTIHMEDVFMKRICKALVLILAAVFCLQTGQIFAAAKDLEAAEDWEVIDTISLGVVSAYAKEILRILWALLTASRCGKCISRKSGCLKTQSLI